MKKLLLALALLLIPVTASAQCNGVFPNNTVCGNVTGASNTPRAVSPSAFLGAAGGTNGQIQYNNGGALAGVGFSANNPLIGAAGSPQVTQGTRTGSTTAFVTQSGATAAQRCATYDVNGNVAASAEGCYSNLYNMVTQGGADNTGATDTSGTVISGIAAATSAGQCAYFPAGTYDLGSTRVRITTNNTCIIGAGKYQSIFRRTTNVNVGTIEVFGAQNVRISHVGISYTAGAGTLGYCQTGFAARAGAKYITFDNLSVTGLINRGIHVINSSDVSVTNSIVVGSSNANMRIVTDKDAAVFACFNDETGIVNTERVIVAGNTFSGETALGNATRAGTSYGLNIATGSTNAADRNFDIRISNNTFRYQNSQGIGIGTLSFYINAVNNVIQNIYDGATSGVGIVIEQAGAYDPTFIVAASNNISNTYIGIYVISTSYVTITGNMISSHGQYGLLFNNATWIIATGNVVAAGGAVGAFAYYLTAICQGVTLSANQAIGNTGTGFGSDATNTQVVETNNISLSNSTAQYANAGTGTWVLANNI